MQNTMNKFVGFLVRMFAKIARTDPKLWLLKQGGRAGLSMQEINRIWEKIKMTKTGNEIRYEDAERTIQLLCADQTVSIEETIANLVSLIGDLEIKIDALRTEL